MLVSPNLSGTVAVTNGSATVTGSSTLFTDGTQGFVIGDTINTSAGSARVIAIASDTSLTVDRNFASTQSGMTYKRGGLTSSCIYYLYAIAEANGANPALVLSTRSVAYGHTFPLNSMPSGYSLYREMACSPYIDSTSNILRFRIAEGWPYAPTLIYSMDGQSTGSSHCLYSSTLSTNSASPTNIGYGALVPLTASTVLLNVANTGVNTGRIFVSLLGSNMNDKTDVIDGSGAVNNNVRIPYYSEGFYAYATYNTTTPTFWVAGYSIGKVR
jgi:hypothetical protein